MSMKVMLLLRCVVLAGRMVVFPSFDVCPFNLYLGSVVYITGDKLLAVKAESVRPSKIYLHRTPQQVNQKLAHIHVAFGTG